MQDGYTSLMIASNNGHEKVVEFLLEHGVKIEAKTWEGKGSRGSRGSSRFRRGRGIKSYDGL